jgi:hypothetical protein
MPLSTTLKSVSTVSLPAALLQMDMTLVMRKYAVGRGDVQNLQDHAARFASMVAAFCERLGWYDLEALIAKFQVGSQLACKCRYGYRPYGPLFSQLKGMQRGNSAASRASHSSSRGSAFRASARQQALAGHLPHACSTHACLTRVYYCMACKPCRAVSCMACGLRSWR